MDNGHFWNCQRTLEKCVMQWKVPQNANVGALHESKLQTFLQLCSLSEPVRRVYTVTLLDTSRECLLVMKVYCTIRKMILLFCYNSGITLLRPLLAWPRSLPGRTIEAGPKDVRLRESWLYFHLKSGKEKTVKMERGPAFLFSASSFGGRGCLPFTQTN